MQIHVGGTGDALPDLIVEVGTKIAGYTAVTRISNVAIGALSAIINIDIPAIIYYGLNACPI